VRERMVWGKGSGGNFLIVEGRVREHSCLPAQVSKRNIKHRPQAMTSY